MYISLITSKKKEELIRAFTDVLKQSGHFDCIQSDSEFIHLESFFKDQEIFRRLKPRSRHAYLVENGIKQIKMKLYAMMRTKASNLLLQN